MLTKVVYNCDPEFLGDVDKADFADAFENEVRVKPQYRLLDIEVNFCPGESCILSISSDDWEADISHDEEINEDFAKFAEKALKACLA